jgi:hypothetical protein
MIAAINKGNYFALTENKKPLSVKKEAWVLRMSSVPI